MRKNPAGRIGLLLAAVFLAAFVLDLLADARGRDCLSWMDPTQYHAFARAILAGGPGDFPVASLFPFLLVPFAAAKDTLPGVLAANLLFALLLAGGAAALARSLRIRLPAAVPVIVVLTAPLLVGLSRELYIEYVLSAAAAWQLALWTGREEPDRGARGVLFGLLFGAGLLLKMTYPVFFVGPWAYDTIRRLRRRDLRSALRLSLVLGVPAAAALAGVRLLAPEMWAYYASLGNTRIPTMRLIGPPDLLSPGSFLYYPWQLFRSGLGLPALLLVLPLLLARRLGGEGEEEERRAVRITALALLVPLLAFTLQAVKEPRHIAPVLAPAAMLLLLALERIRRAPLRSALVAATLLFSIGQYLAITRGGVSVPYYMKDGLGIGAIESLLVRSDPEGAAFRDGAGRVDINRWRFTKSLALSGFGPNEALALAWRFAPAVVYDLDGGGWDSEDRRAYDRYEDLFQFPAFNMYNRRCNWPHAYRTLDRDAVIEAADYLLIRGMTPAEGRARHPDRRLVGLVEEGSEPVLVLAPPLVPFESFRELYARETLRRRPGMDRRERNAICFDLFLEKTLEGRPVDRNILLRGFPDGYEPGTEMRNIYWLAPYRPLLAAGKRAYRHFLERGY